MNHFISTAIQISGFKIKIESVRRKRILFLLTSCKAHIATPIYLQFETVNNLLFKPAYIFLQAEKITTITKF